MFGIFCLAAAVVALLFVSYQTVTLFYSLLTVYIFFVFLTIWLDGAWRTISPPKPAKWPGVSIIIPSYNSASTLRDCVAACKRLRYAGKAEIIVIDDGSTDGSCESLRIAGVKVFRKENGGKASAMNFGIKKASYGRIVCVDSDSYPREDALEKMVPYMEEDSKVGAVVLFICVSRPKSLLAKVQEIEYWVSYGFFLKALDSIGGLYVTPGPMALYRREVFEKLGGFEEKNITEDMEIALRMQKNGWKIRACHQSVVYTEAPDTLQGVFRQRFRWFRGGFANVIKYFDMFFNEKFGAFGFFVLPLILVAGFFASTFMLWILASWAKSALSLVLPSLGNMKTLGDFIVSAPGSLDYMAVDSVFIFSIFCTLIWCFFVYKSFQITGNRFGPKHAVPMALLLFAFPLFLGFTFLASYAAEFTGLKRGW